MLAKAGKLGLSSSACLCREFLASFGLLRPAVEASQKSRGSDLLQPRHYSGSGFSASDFDLFDHEVPWCFGNVWRTCGCGFLRVGFRLEASRGGVGFSYVPDCSHDVTDP